MAKTAAKKNYARPLLPSDAPRTTDDGQTIGPDPGPISEFVGICEVAAAYGVDRATIRAWLVDEPFPMPWRLSEHVHRWSPVDLALHADYLRRRSLDLEAEAPVYTLDDD